MADIFDRLHAALKVLVRESIPDQTFSGIWSYTVTNFHAGDQTADLSPANNQALPYLEKVPIRLPGLQSKLSPNQSVLIGFADRDPTKPFVAHLDFASTYSGALAIARQGDMAASGGNGTTATFYVTPTDPSPLPMTTLTPYLISFGSLTGVPVGPPPPLQGMLYGCVSSGSTVNKSK